MSDDPLVNLPLAAACHPATPGIVVTTVSYTTSGDTIGALAESPSTA